MCTLWPLTAIADYELALLDLVTDNGLDWKGNPNELVASYAADGYARITGAAAFVTTFGPGELSAYCGMAGHYCEFVPVCHIVGYPGVPAQNAHMIMHHSLGTGQFESVASIVRVLDTDVLSACTRKWPLTSLPQPSS
jgi:pyruvate decarboxylase